jgi:heme/copper-type cytochrome/quinol oxidase subunit 2
VVICGLLTMADGTGTIFDVNLIDFFEIFWLMRPIIFFVTIGLTTRGLTYELLANDWFDMIIVLAAAQWYWNESIICEEHTNSTLIDTWYRTIREEMWRICGSSSDVLHSFSLKEFGFHTDCIPGKIIMHMIHVFSAGVSFITCQELCGYRHSGIVLGINIE